MLDKALENRIRETVRASLDPRDRSLVASLSAVTNSQAARGMYMSGSTVKKFMTEGKAELDSRSEFIFRTVVRAHESMSGQLTETLREDLGNELAGLIAAEAGRVAKVTGSKLAGDLKKYDGRIADEIRDRGRERIRQLSTELDFYLDSLRKRAAQPNASAPTFVFHGSVGAVQSGPGAVANVVMQSADQERLATALDELRAAIGRDSTSTAGLQQDVAGLVDDTKAALKAERPSGHRIFGLLSGLGQAVQTVGSARAAWEAVKAAAAAAGINLT